ncbi:hypothetical protein F4776DRAFT_616075 [Hypoxylon sp. NC0597]|nr:hypothetical protein F4776DRAFT_616075 [Hypoxylon sp. NC0597]
MDTYNPDAAHPVNGHPQDMQRVVYPMSQNYLGNHNLAANYSAPIPNSRNTSLWIVGLPPTLTYPQLLGSIRRCGKVKATCINFANQYHPTSAAKVVFFTHDAAVRLMNQASGLVIDGYRPLIRWNRIRTAESDEKLGSRVIRITGPRQLVSLENLQIFFLSRFDYDLDRYGASSRCFFGDSATSLPLLSCYLHIRSLCLMHCVTSIGGRDEDDWEKLQL